MEDTDNGGDASDGVSLRHTFVVFEVESGGDLERVADGTVAGVLVEGLGDLALDVLPNASAQWVFVVEDVRGVRLLAQLIMTLEGVIL